MKNTTIETMYKYLNGETVDVEALRKDLQDKTEAELWTMRNKYFEMRVEALDTPMFKYFVEVIGEIDKQIYALQDQEKRRALQ